MKDYRKLIIVVDVGIGDLSPHKARELLAQVQHHLETKFDDSVKILCLPNRDTMNIVVKLLNTNPRISVKELERVIDRAEETIKKL